MTMNNDLEKVADIFTIIVAIDGIIEEVFSLNDQRIAKQIFYDKIIRSGQILDTDAYKYAVKEGQFIFSRGNSTIAYHLVTQPIFKKKTLIPFDPEKL